MDTLQQTDKELNTVQPTQQNSNEELFVAVEELSSFESRGACMGDDPGDNND